MRGQLPRVEGPECGALIGQRVSTLVHESGGRITQRSLALSLVATKCTNEKLCG